MPSAKVDRLRALWTNPVGIRALLWSRLPLAAFAGLRVEAVGEEGARVGLPAGWRTQNPFRSIYFAAQAMAAELSTGVPALLFVEDAGAPISFLVTGLSARFTRKATSHTVFAFADGASMKAAVARAAESGEPVLFTARSRGTQADGTHVADFEITWSFKRRGAA